MVGLLEKMGDAIESMESDIGQINDFLKVITLNQMRVEEPSGSVLPAFGYTNNYCKGEVQVSNLEQVAELSQLGLLPAEAFNDIEEQAAYYEDQEKVMETYDQMEVEEEIDSLIFKDSIDFANGGETSSSKEATTEEEEMETTTAAA